MTSHGTTRRMITGAAAGLAGTMVIKGLQTTGQKTVPEEMPPLRQDPGEYMVEKVEGLLPEKTREHVPRTVEKAASQLLSLGYGLTFGSLFGLSRKRPQHVMVEGTALGLLAWGAGYLGWLPALGLMPPVYRQKPGQVAGGIVSHIIYGITTVAAVRFLERKT